MNNKILLSIIIGAALGVPCRAALTRIGAAGGVSGRVTATAPEAGAAARALAGGKTVYFKDKVLTSAGGRLQVLLLDQTVFTMGPDGEMVLDEFVYDPFTQTGQVSATITKGVFRFVTGKIAKKQPSKMKVALPSGTIGIRGTIAAGRVGPDGSLVALLGPGPNNNSNERPGAISVTNAGVTVEITRPGYATVIAGANTPPTPPAPLTNEQLASLDTTPPAESGGGQDEPGGSTGNTATEESGQDTAGASGDLQETESTGGLQEELDESSTEGIQTAAAAGGITQWETLRAIPSGSAFYDASGFSYSCSGGITCSSGGSGTLAFHFQIDWGARTLGGGGGSSHVAFESGTMPFLDSQIPVVNFSSLQGDAKLTFGTDFTGTNSDFDGTTFSFQNGGKEAHLTLTYTGTTAQSGANQNGVVATGNATAICQSGTCP